MGAAPAAALADFDTIPLKGAIPAAPLFSPALLIGASLGLGAISALSGIAGSQQSARAAQANAQYQAQVDQENAQLAKQNAKFAEQSGVAQAEQQNMKNRARIGGVLASQGANGITIGQGSAADVEDTTEKLGQLDSATIMSNAARQAYGFETQGASYQAEANLQTNKADEIPLAADLESAGSLLGTASSSAGQYASWRLLSGAPGARTTFLNG